MTTQAFRLFVGCTLTLSVMAGYGIAQPEQHGRYEKEQKLFDPDFIIIPLRHDGIALYRDLRDYQERDQVREIILLDTLLREKAVLTARVETRSQFKGYEHTPGEVHLLFSKNETRGELEIVSVNITDKTVTHHKITAEIKFQLTHFIKVNQCFVLAGYYDSEPVILIYNIPEKKLKLVPGLFQKNTELIDVRGNQNKTFNVVMVDREIREAGNVIFRTFDAYGTQLIEDIIPIKDRTLLSGISSTLEREDLILLGSWGDRNAKQSLGFYSIRINPFEDQEGRYNFFGELTHYLDYLKPKRAAQIQEKTKAALANKKYPPYTNHIMPYKIVERPDGFLLLAETYSPSNRTNQYPMYNSNPYGYGQYYYNPYGMYYPYNNLYGARPMYGNNVVNEADIKTIQSVVIAFDAHGNVTKDYAVKLDDIKSSAVSQISDFHVTRDSLTFLYKDESVIKIKSINLADEESRSYQQKIKLNEPTESSRNEEKAGEVRQWYGHNFYVWGYHTVRSTAQKTRTVFYINRITIR